MAFLSTSGVGAAIDGGRFNRPGVEALYLSQASQTALEEDKQGASISPPARLAAYKITLAEVADLSQGFDPNVWNDGWREWDCAWRRIARIDRKTPPSWRLADQVRRMNCLRRGLTGDGIQLLMALRASQSGKSRSVSKPKWDRNAFVVTKV